MEFNFDKSATKKYLYKLNTSPQDKVFIEECARKIFDIFNHQSEFIRFNGQRYYLSGEFEGLTLNPSNSVAETISEISELSTFRNDPRFKLSTFGEFKIIHPDDLNKVEYIFSSDVSAFNLESKNLNESLIQFGCMLIFYLKNGLTKFQFRFEKKKRNLFTKTLCALMSGGLAKSKTKVYINTMKQNQ